MSDFLTDSDQKIVELETAIKHLDEEATRLETMARDCRSERHAKRAELQQLHATIADAKLMHAAQTSLSMTMDASKQIVGLKGEADKVLSELQKHLDLFKVVVEAQKAKAAEKVEIKPEDVGELPALQ